MTRFFSVSGVFILSAAFSCGFAEPSASSSEIGFAVTSGTMRVNNVDTRRSATLSAGSQVETGNSGSAISLRSGTQIDLGVHSRGRVYGDRLVLEEGTTQLSHLQRYALQADTLRVLADSPSSSVSVAKAPGSIQVTSLRGNARVLDQNGALLAEVNPGMTAIFAASAGAGTPGPGPEPAGGGQGGGGGHGNPWALIFLGTAAATGAILGGLAAAGTFSNSTSTVSVP